MATGSNQKTFSEEGRGRAIHDTALFQRSLLDWYDRSKRKLPWRLTSDPYAILVSELMLQQTQVKTVIPYFQRFMKRFPDPQALAEADEQEVLKAWQGLGYYRRARYLQTACRQILEEYDNRFPSGKAEIDKLKGVGAYTSAAVASIAFNLCYACVDGNVERVLSRIMAWDDDIKLTATRSKMTSTAQGLISKTRPGDYNQALMELGATVCTPKKPSCLPCPVNGFCKTYQWGEDPEKRPYKSKRIQPSKMDYQSLFLVCDQRFLVTQRKDEGLMASMWELPSQALNDLVPWSSLLEGTLCFLGYFEKRLKHKFTHLHASYQVSIHSCDQPRSWTQLPNAYQASRWVTFTDLEHLPITKVLQKALPQLKPHLDGAFPCQEKTSTLPGVRSTY